MSATAVDASRSRGGHRGDKSFLGHPRGLATLFMTEMWERFSFYGMRAILVLFLVAPAAKGGLGMNAALAAAIYGVYNALVYMLALPGGWVADRLTGTRRAVLWGGVVIASGHYVLAIPSEATVFLGLLLVALGTGLLKPNMSAMVGDLYDDDDPRRDAGFSIFYMGINLGAFAAPLVTGYLGEKVDWHLGFGAAAVGMTLALVQYVVGGKHLGDVGTHPGRPATAEERSAVTRKVLLWLGVAVAALALDVALGTYDTMHVVNALTVLAVVVPVVYFAVMLRTPAVDATERSRTWAFLWIFVAATVFWLIYDQAGSVVSVFTEQEADRHVFGWEVPASWFQSLNPLLIMSLAPLFALMWVRLAERQPSTPRKFAFGLVGIGLAFVLMAGAASAADGPGLISPMWIVGFYVVQTVAELLLSPVGLSVSSKLAPARFGGQVMGLWFLATSTGNAIGGQVARLTEVVPGVVYYGLLGGLTVVGGLAMVAATGRIRALMAGVS